MSYGEMLWKLASKGNDAPCKNCSARNVGCHSTCESYISWKKRFEEKKNQAYVKTRPAYSIGPREKRRLYLIRNS